jgi:hypothetical protein
MLVCKVVESEKPGLRLLLTRIIPEESLASANTTSFWAPKIASDFIVKEMLPLVNVDE